MHSKVSAIDFFLMQMGKKESCSKLRRAFLITTTVEPVGNVVGSKETRIVCVCLCITLLCCALCYVSASNSVRSVGLLNVVTNMHSHQGLHHASVSSNISILMEKSK